jgi:endonuclease YncB( thermonuclease family)
MMKYIPLFLISLGLLACTNKQEQDSRDVASIPITIGDNCARIVSDLFSNKSENLSSRNALDRIRTRLNRGRNWLDLLGTTSLKLEGLDVSDQELIHLLPELKAWDAYAVDLSLNPKLTDKSLEHLHKHMSDLKQLDLSMTRIGGFWGKRKKVLKYIVKHFPELTEFTPAYLKMSDLELLLQLEDLRELNLSFINPKEFSPRRFLSFLRKAKETGKLTKLDTVQLPTLRSDRVHKRLVEKMRREFRGDIEIKLGNNYRGEWTGRVIDGDTPKFNLVDTEASGMTTDLSIRLKYIDTAETKGLNAAERRVSAAGKNYVQWRLHEAKDIFLTSIEDGTFAGRKLGVVFVDDDCLNLTMMEKGLALYRPTADKVFPNQAARKTFWNKEYQENKSFIDFWRQVSDPTSDDLRVPDNFK